MSGKELPPIVYGIETEYTGTITSLTDMVEGDVGVCHRGEEASRAFTSFRFDEDEDYVTPFHLIGESAYWEAFDAVGLGFNEEGMLSNGARLYIDESGPEYCTPEATSAEEVVHRMFAGDRILTSIFAHMREKGVIASARFNRRSCDHQGNSRGTHINTPLHLSQRSEDGGYLITPEPFAILNTAKGAICGAGGLLVDPTNGDTNFHHSPRLSRTSIYTSAGSLNEKPLVRAYLKPDVGCCRLETVTGDALNFAWPMRASLVLTQAMSRLVSAGIDPFEHHVMVEPLKAARDVGQFGNDARIPVWIGGKLHDVKPANLLSFFAQSAIKSHQELGLLDDEMIQVLHEVINVCDMIESSPESVDHIVESVARKKFLDSRREGRKDYGGEKLCKLDYRWDTIGVGIAERLRENNKVGWLGFSAMHSVRAQRRRMHFPPTDTRAKLRADIIRGEIAGEVTSWYCMEDESGLTYFVPPLATDFSQGVFLGRSVKEEAEEYYPLVPGQVDLTRAIDSLPDETLE